MEPQFAYPLAPQGVDEKIFDTTPAFRAGVLKTTATIVLFVITYIVLLALAVCLAILCGYAGLAFYRMAPQFITAILGLGMAGVGVMVIYFLLRFVFTYAKTDTSRFIEVAESEQPGLFAFVRRISQETQAPFPKKIYLSDDVNASVFYDSNFWSMFLPVKKNLRIGLGLVNVINVSEFKAVLAHEFGHFSQQSMKFGVYVYNVNNVIYKMLYDNQSYADTLDSWARVSSYFRIFAYLTTHIISGIQAILRQVYIVINKSYSALSIEMEYNADAVAASVSGTVPLVTSLKKLNIGQVCYNNVLNYCHNSVPANLRSANFYLQQRMLLKLFAGEHNITVKNDDLQMSEDGTMFLSRSRITIKDQWASHPSLHDREKRLKELNLATNTITDSAWTLFAEAEQLQTSMTDKMYETVTFKAKPQMIDPDVFIKEFDNLAAGRFAEEYKGYYDSREIGPFDTGEVIKSDQGGYTFNELFSDANCGLPARINSLKADIETLIKISDKATGIRSFDFDGVKYSYKRALDIQGQLTPELKAAEHELKELDKKVFAFFYHNVSPAEKQAELEKHYLDMFAAEAETRHDLQLYNEVMNAMNPIYGERRFNEIYSILLNVKFFEDKMLPRLTEVLEKAEKFDLTEYQIECIDKYLKSDRTYFTKPNFDNQAIAVFNKAMHAFAAAMADRNFVIKKNLLAVQLKTSRIYP
ncbi:hypothetical protein BEL04_15630 [Mucilaginibacter sp. PPCGB 2223]|uniref:M48 family metallopeptidase n=1 Tax=Mucilaginibacter sp. PPCGB 2223 TaxID=1886027 RepID=UPI000826B090|nr:M48 family metallopeptidase [Mucilaginibacter sp. PPCGB 2223]OCX51456.1 hypothetical protein BEL04_15630 [Mucilaginibacter sp. PPCGB 2223]